MSNLHDRLMVNSNWYNSWHSHRGHGLAHWFMFMFVAIILTSAVSDGINKNYLQNNLTNIAAVIASQPTVSPIPSKTIPGQYIIEFKDSVINPKGLAEQLTREHGGELLFAYEHAIKGFAAKIPDVAINGLRKNPNIKIVELDKTVQATAYQTQTPSWGIDRIDQHELPLNAIYTYNYTGAGVHVYVVDTGIDSTHNEFTGRVGNGFTSVLDGRGAEDCNGHGTHVSGTIGGTTFGVAKNVILHSVRVLNCEGSGTDSEVLAGIDWVSRNITKPAVANMSFSGDKNQILTDAINNLLNSGVTVVAAAGNAASNACDYYPAYIPDVITVAASNNVDGWATYSNTGTCVDLFAPGHQIVSSIPGNSYATKSGTSMATPHVSGVAALYLEQQPSSTPAEVSGAIVLQSTANVIQNVPAGTVNLLLNSLLDGSGPVLDTQAPTTPTYVIANATYINYPQIQVSWQASTDNTGVKGYKLYRNGSFYTSVGSNTYYNDTSVTGGDTYTYSVSAYDTTGNESSLSNTITAVAPTTPIADSSLSITGYRVSNKTATSITITWSTNINSTGWVNYARKNSASQTYVENILLKTHSVTLSGLLPKSAYNFTIQAVAGNAIDSVSGSFRTSSR